MIALAAFLSLLAGGAAALLLRRAWADRGARPPLLVPAAWAIVAAALVLAALAVGPVKGVAVAAGMVSLGALAVVAQGRVLRPARIARDALAPEPLEGPSRAWRGWLKALLAGPLGMTAAMGIAFCYAAWAPGDPRTRIVVGGMLMPFAWALAMTWTLADQRLLRALAVLAGTTVLGFALAAVRGVA